VTKFFCPFYMEVVQMEITVYITNNNASSWTQGVCYVQLSKEFQSLLWNFIRKLHLYLHLFINNSMEQSPSSKANSFSGTQKLPWLLWNLKVPTVFTKVYHWYTPWTRQIQCPPIYSLFKIQTSILQPLTAHFS
jgi:hypothetical protein